MTISPSSILLLSFFFCASACGEELYWMVYDMPELNEAQYSSAQAACRAGIKAKENRHDPNEYEWRVVGDFYFGGSYTWGNLGKLPSDPSFKDSERELFCTHEYRDKDLPFWKGFAPYSGATLRLIGDVCPTGQRWNPLVFGCQDSPANFGESCNNTGAPMNMATGNKHYRESDYAQPGPNSLQFVRYYNSLLADENWRSSYQRSLRIDANVITVVRDDGKEIRFQHSAPDWIGPSQRKELLYQEADGYRLLLPNNSIEHYDVDGRLQSIRQDNGSEIQLSYTTDRVTATRFGANLTMEKNQRGRVTSVLTPDGEEIRYVWETGTGISRLKSVIYPDDTPDTISDNDARHYHYSARHPDNIVKVTDGEGLVTSEVSYDGRGRAVSSQKASGVQRSELTYNADGSTTVRNALGKETTYRYTQINGAQKVTLVEGHASSNCAAANRSYTYDSRGRVETKTSWGGKITRFAYNERGLETSRTEAEGTPEEHIIYTEWHPTLNLRTKITEPGKVVNYSYDDQGRLLNRAVNDLRTN